MNRRLLDEARFRDVAQSMLTAIGELDVSITKATANGIKSLRLTTSLCEDFVSMPPAQRHQLIVSLTIKCASLQVIEAAIETSVACSLDLATANQVALEQHPLASEFAAVLTTIWVFIDRADALKRILSTLTHVVQREIIILAAASQKIPDSLSLDDRIDELLCLCRQAQQ